MARVKTAEIVAVYRETASIWETGKRLGISGQSVHERLRAYDFPMIGLRRWTDDEVGELRLLVEAGLTASKISSRLGRTFASVTCKMNELGIRVSPRNRSGRKIPRGVGLDKVSVLKHMDALEKSGAKPTHYARMNGLNIDSMVYALQTHCDERWQAHAAKVGGLAEKTCEYCERKFFPTSGKQRFCTRKCGADSGRDATYFGGRRKEAIGLLEGVCQLCSQQRRRGLSAHHVLGKENDPDDHDLVALCQGCHKLVSLLGSRNFVDDPSAWEALIQLAWWRKHGSKIASGGLDGKATYVCVEIEIQDADEE